MSGGVLPVILAAGRASRFDGRKIDRECAGRPLGSWVIAALEAADSGHGLIVAREPNPAFADHATGWDVVLNDAPERGMGHSLALASRVAEQQGACAMLVALGDMPLIPQAHFAQLFAEALRGASTVATRYPGDGLGVPACFAAEHFEALSALDGDAGAARLLQNPRGRVTITANPDWLIDVDGMDGLRRAEALLRRRVAAG